MLRGDQVAAVKLLLWSDAVVSPPARIVYRLIHADPVLAAGLLVQALDELGEDALVVASVAYIAYDQARSARTPGLAIYLERDGAFLAALLDRLGESWMDCRFSEAFALFGEWGSNGEVAADFVSQYRATLAAAASTVSDDAARGELQRIIQ